jgi:dihydroorotase-like cyclic amidohydrolase
VKADVGVTGEKIACIGDLAGAEAPFVIDAEGKYVLPGMIDFHTHIREPGQEFKEDYTTGTMAEDGTVSEDTPEFDEGDLSIDGSAGEEE